MHLNKEDGYTLVEMLLVLMIVGILATGAMHFTVKKIEKNQLEQFFEQFQIDMHYLQSYAMANGVTVRIHFTQDGYGYFGIVGNTQKILTRSMPKGLSGNKDNTYHITYLPNGNVSEFGKVTFTTPNGWKKITVYIGKGRMVLNE